MPVSAVLNNLAAGIDPAELRENYPSLPEDAIPLALAYAADLAREQILPMPAA